LIVAAAEFVIIIILSAGVGYWGWTYFQKSLDPAIPRLPASFDINVGSQKGADIVSLRDDAGPLRVTSIAYQENHGDPWRDGGLTYIPAPNEAGGVNVSINVVWDRPTISDVPVEVAVSLPDAAMTGGSAVCDTQLTINIPNQTGGWTASPGSALDRSCVIDRKMDLLPHLVLRSLIKAQQSSRGLTAPTGFFLTARVTNIDGIGFTTSRTRAETHLPVGSSPTDIPVLRSPTDIPVAASSTDMKVTYRIPSADQFSWSEQTADRTSGDFTEWRYRSGGIVAPPPAPSSGIRQDLLEQNSRNAFLGGVLLAIAGGGIIPLVQLLFRIIETRHSRTSRNRPGSL
jgi:hypothetical protein